jgi:hypothetical protein
MKHKRSDNADEKVQWLITLVLGPPAAVLAGIVAGLLMRGTGLR